MCYTRRKIEGGVGALREFDDANFLKPNGQSRNLNIYDKYTWPEVKFFLLTFTHTISSDIVQMKLSEVELCWMTGSMLKMGAAAKCISLPSGNHPESIQ